MITDKKIKLVHGENFLDSGYFGDRDSCLEMYTNRAFRALVIFNFLVSWVYSLCENLSAL